MFFCYNVGKRLYLLPQKPKFMKNFTINTPIVELGYDELTPEENELVQTAREAATRAYAPYSHFNVGAAIRLSSGTIVPGSNQENAAFPSGTCAERSACYYAHARYPEEKFQAIAISTIGTDGRELDEPASPCGACRQALVEYEHLAGHPVPVYLAGRTRIYKLPSVASLLPLAFTEF